MQHTLKIELILLLMGLSVCSSGQDVFHNPKTELSASRSGITQTNVSDNSAVRSTWYGDKERGWFWYEDPPDDRGSLDSGLNPPPSAVSVDPLFTLKAYQEKLERAKALAVMTPTADNVRAYLEMNRDVQRRATTFADMTQRVVWATPQLDQSLVRPHSKEGLAAYTADKNQSRDRDLREIAQTHGLYFVFSTDCPYCVKFSPYLLRFAQQYGFTVIPITTDGYALPEFPNARYAPGVAEKLGVEVTPAVFLVEPNMQSIQAVAYGVVSMTELETRILRLMTREPGQMNYSVYKQGELE